MMKTTKNKYTTLTVLILTLILLCSSCTSKNVKMGLKNCKSGNYEAAAEFYRQEINEGKADDSVKTTYDALSVYLKSKAAYDSDDMAELSKGLEKLKNTDSTYPTETEINELRKQYETRKNEINSYDKSIEEVSAMFSDINNITAIKNSCDELLKKKITAAQKSKVNDIKNNADSYIYIKSNYDNANYPEIVKFVDGLSKPTVKPTVIDLDENYGTKDSIDGPSKPTVIDIDLDENYGTKNSIDHLPQTYKNYGTKDSIDQMYSEAKKVVDERNRIDRELNNLRNSFNSSNYDSSLPAAISLLEMNLTAEEREEVQTIKSTSEQKIEEAKLAAEQAEKEAKQRMIDEAIKISASSLYNEFTENHVGADTKYKNKVLLVTGTVYTVDKVILFGTPYLSLKAGYTADAVTAYFSSATVSQLTDISKGQTVKILGKCTGRSMGRVVLDDCSIVE